MIDGDFIQIVIVSDNWGPEGAILTVHYKEPRRGIPEVLQVSIKRGPHEISKEGISRIRSHVDREEKRTGERIPFDLTPHMKPLIDVVAEVGVSMDEIEEAIEEAVYDARYEEDYQRMKGRRKNPIRRLRKLLETATADIREAVQRVRSWWER